MNYAFIDHNKRPSLYKIKPKIHNFCAENKLYIFPGKCRERRLKRALIKYKCSLFPNECSYNFKIKIWHKTIIHAMKEYGYHEVIFCSENYLESINLLESMFKSNVYFSLISLGDCDKAVDYFLDKYGFPVRITKYPQSNLVVYIDGVLPYYKNNILDLSGTLDCKKIIVSEYILKNTNFPFSISSLPLLEGALMLTEKETEDIIIKLCIIGTKCE